MKEEETYLIEYKGLARGEHKFHFTADATLFADFDSDEILSGNLSVDVIVEKGASTSQLEMTIDGDVDVVCDRCLDPVTLPINFHDSVIVKESDGEQSDDVDILWIPAQAESLDLRQYIYESICLSLPYQRVHQDGECNPDMLARFSIVEADEFDSKYSDDDQLDDQDFDDNDELAGVEVETLSDENIKKLEALKNKLLK